jgi:hypothetical protein
MTPTQTRFPLRATLRTLIQAGIPLAAAAPLIYTAATQHNPAEATGWAATALLITGALTRIMAIPAVNDALARVGLSAAPRSVEPAGQGEDLEVAPQLIPGTALDNVPVYADTHGGDAPVVDESPATFSLACPVGCYTRFELPVALQRMFYGSVSLTSTAMAEVTIPAATSEIAEHLRGHWEDGSYARVLRANAAALEHRASSIEQYQGAVDAGEQLTGGQS